MNARVSLVVPGAVVGNYLCNSLFRGRGSSGRGVCAIVIVLQFDLSILLLISKHYMFLFLLNILQLDVTVKKHGWNSPKYTMAVF